MTCHRFALSVLFTLAAGCAQPVLNPMSQHDAPSEEGARAEEGSPEALGMIAFLNDESTTYELLDVAVGLDRRAAESIIAHRNGPDGILGWLHDDLYDSVAEIDARYYVGATALAKIEAWAIDNGWVALGPDDELGTWDGVTFTVAEAEATVELANTAGWDYLDHDLAMDARAVQSIWDARPIASVQELAGLYYVGNSALTALKGAAEGAENCDVPGWETLYIYDENDANVPTELRGIIDEVLMTDDWCGAADGEPYFVKVTVDRYECKDTGYTIELGQTMMGYGTAWYIEFEIDGEFGWFHSTCEV